MSTAPRLGAARRDWGTDDSATPILHVDMDAFFVEVELLDRPELRGRAVIVGGSSARGVVSSASYQARAAGVHAGQPISQARRLCPQAVVLATSHGRYAAYSRRVMDILASFTPAVEKVSVDEAFLDVSGARRLWGSPVEIAAAIRRRIRTEVGLPASVGIAATKLVAKVASSHAKPDGVLLIPQAASTDFLHMLPVGALWGVGPAARARLERRGIHTIRDLAHEPVESLVSVLGETSAHRLHELAWARDPRPVAQREREKSMGTETTFADDVADIEVLRACLLDQAHATAARLRAGRMKAMTIAVKIRFADFTTLTRSHTLTHPIDTGREIARIAHDLIGRIAIPRAGVRLIGVRAENLQPVDAGWQLAILDDERTHAVEEAMDAVSARFGARTLTPARLLRARGRESE
ncbi:DNA polymerase IV [Nanchangia anserum]|uniref:DNA polymerase IV n=1 Tax=Nanchangia anserum TaxID=2692125 RepID=A0A8I0KWR7_9ACTO|nr:DNA polymerase IV [Nanchangia anserum]MBD3690249.1 DNA polymerase IV [Nanchangia anserum]QOX82309.1 DNA polymerase IV [Nanchangia anserum]